ncbi:MAG: hypothetical protein QM756_36070 [Polyangiaceae bacterium]
MGWYPEFAAGGCFKLMVVVDEDWEAPAHTAECRTLFELGRVFAKGLEIARGIERSR